MPRYFLNYNTKRDYQTGLPTGPVNRMDMCPGGKSRDVECPRLTITNFWSRLFLSNCVWLEKLLISADHNLPQEHHDYMKTEPIHFPNIQQRETVQYSRETI